MGISVLVLLTMGGCSPVWFLTRSDEVILPVRLEENGTQSVSFSAKFPGRRYRVYLRFDRTVPFEEVKCLVGDLGKNTCPEPEVPVKISWAVSVGESVLVQGDAVPRFERLTWANDYVEVLLGEFYPEPEKVYRVFGRVTGDGSRWTPLRPKLLVLSYYNPLDKNIHVSPSDAPSLPNYSFHRTAYGGR